MVDIRQFIETELTSKEISEIDFRVMGNIVLEQTRSLIQQLNEILNVMGRWIDDPEWMERLKIYEDDVPHWARYKRTQRQWTEQQKWLAAERLRMFWKAIQRKRKLRAELSRCLHSGMRCGAVEVDSPRMSNDLLAPILSPLSPKEQHRADTEREFAQAFNLPPSSKLPWRAILSQETTKQVSFDQLNQYLDNTRSDKASKLLHLLQMETDGVVSLHQEEHCGSITIKPTNPSHESYISIKDQTGAEYDLEWSGLSDAQRNKVIADTLGNRILCKSVWA
jgi:hypothetical protein